ncbi:putative membrane protein [Clostridium sp. CAG:411]|jgi:drug/metabolite transporter (DMT)-like permease|nr:DMT family transporter [Lachnospiraceae bacterium]CDE43301.1 putative membrane protein [Clostridium sp. CAG:411]
MKEKNKGILFILLAGVFFASMTIFSRLSGDLPTMQKAFFRNFFAAILAFFMLIKNQHNFSYPPSLLPMLFVRSICGTIGILCNFYAIDHLVVSDANILNKVSPFAAVVFSYFFLKEKISLRQICTLLGAFFGALLIIKPSFAFSDFAPGAIGLLGGIMAGAAYTAVRYLGQKKLESMKIVFFFSTFSCLSIFPFVVTNYAPMRMQQLLFLICCGICAAGGQICITKAYTYAPANEISIYDYFQILVAAILGFFIFNQTPDFISVFGYLIIFAMSFINWWYSNHKTTAE